MNGAAGHNERSFRLDVLAKSAREAITRVEHGEAEAFEGWLAYGAALNEARALFPSDKEFGQWIDANLLRQLDGVEVSDHERAAAMWAAANAEQLAEARAASKARTIRGLHAKWKEIEAERARAEAEAQRQVERDAEAQAPGIVEKAVNEIVARGEEPTKAKVKRAVLGGDEDAPAPEAEDPLKPYRKGLSSFTREGLEDEIAGLRAEVESLRRERKQLRKQVQDLKERLREFEQAEDLGRALGNAQRRLRGAVARSKEWQATAARLQGQVNAQAKELKRLRPMARAAEEIEL